MKLVPHGDSVICRGVEDNRTHGGLFVPGKTAEKRKRAIVIAVGRDCKFLKLGDWILTKLESTVQEFDVTGERLYQCSEADVCATVELEAGDPPHASPEDKKLIIAPTSTIQ